MLINLAAEDREVISNSLLSSYHGYNRLIQQFPESKEIEVLRKRVEKISALLKRLKK